MNSIVGPFILLPPTSAGPAIFDSDECTAAIVRIRDRVPSSKEAAT
jgi:hypothetical protein